MSDNFTANAGTGGDTFASDDIDGVQYPRSKIVIGADGVNGGDVHAGNPLPVGGTVAVSNMVAQGLTDAQLRATDVGVSLSTARQSYWPGYTGPSDAAAGTLSTDDSGALITRGAVVTDEGTFRVNFANTSLAVSIGAVTVSGNVVTGTGFLASEAHYRDYFKLQADADTAWIAIESIDSDTQLTLASSYVGGASGTGQRSLVMPMIGSGGSLSVASGALTITSGATNSAITGIKRFTDYAPLVFRAACSVSQRIANQEIHIGLEEDAATTRWFARFLLDGTTNTTLKCETGRNPTGTPSASETQSTIVTLPNGTTTAVSNEYRVELLTESVRFFINGILVAQHTRVIPHQHDPMTSHVEVRNGTGATTTNVVVDYLTGKNHNKLEIGVMSDAEQILAASPPMPEFVYNVAGVITINTDLLVVDCSQLRSLNIHCSSMGTTGVVTPQWSNFPDFTGATTATLISEAGATSTTFNAAVLRSTNVRARYFRLRLTTATTAGTTTIRVTGSQTNASPIVTTQPVSGTVTANIGTGALAAGTNAIGDVGLQGRANATGAVSVAKIASAATTNATSVKATAGRVFGWHLTNTTAAVKIVRLYNLAVAPTVGTSVPVYNIVLPANATVTFNNPIGIGHATGISYAITNAIADLDATAVAANDVIGAIHWL